MSAVVEVRGIRKVYATKSGDVLAIDGLDLVAQRGEFVSLIGPSGCGKSTLLKMVLGVEEISSGEIVVAGGQRRKGAVGMVFQSASLMPWRNVIDNVMLPVQTLGLDRRTHLEKARALLDLAGLSGFEDKFPRELSGGMQQRASICRALVYDPEILLMDEPFGALDAMTREIMQRELLRIWDSAHKTILFVTHSIDEAVLLSDTVVVMSARPGRIIEKLRVDLPRPRNAASRALPQFQSYAAHLRNLLGVSG